MLEVLAPAGDAACLEAALSAGADAIYFGLDVGFNARARATNLAAATLKETLQRIHDHGRRGYLALNTLVFDHEFDELERVVAIAAAAAVDAIIVQDMGVAALIHATYPSLRLHASTQMTCTDADSIRFAESLGVSRVTLARELSMREISALANVTTLELEAFAHGALCIAYSGQCMTSEALGGRSANRGACAQACRLPYDLLVDGVVRDLGDAAYLLSPRDLDASRAIPEIMASGLHAVKIEGRLKGPEYVAATTRLYRIAVDAAGGHGNAPAPADRELATQMFSRGASFGFLHGVDHQQLVDATHCDHVGIEVGFVHAVNRVGNRCWLRLQTQQRLARGDGILIQGGRATGVEVGGRIWLLRADGRDVEQSEAVDDLWVWLGPDRTVDECLATRRVFRTSSVALDQQAARLANSPAARVPIRAELAGQFGYSPNLTLSTRDGRTASVALDCTLQPSHNAGITLDAIRSKLSRLGDTAYALAELTIQLPDNALLPMSSLNRARREAVKLLSQATLPPHQRNLEHSLESMLVWPTRSPPAAGLYVTCRTLEQAEAALAAGASGIYLDFLALTGLGPAFRALHGRGVPIGVAMPRIRKVNEERIDDYVRRLQPDALLLRSLGSFMSFGADEPAARNSDASYRPWLIADFSLNVTNTLSALRVLGTAISAFTPSFDLDAAQLCALLDSRLGPYAEVVIHHPMPLFHMEHCVIAALLSNGHDHHDCGRPCDTHRVSLRDRKGVELPVEADIGCRNTVLHGTSQSAARHLARLRSAGVARFRVELLRESAEVTRRVIEVYHDLLADRCTPSDVRKRLAAIGLPVVEGSLRVIG